MKRGPWKGPGSAGGGELDEAERHLLPLRWEQMHRGSRFHPSARTEHDGAGSVDLGPKRILVSTQRIHQWRGSGAHVVYISKSVLAYICIHL